MAAVTILSDFAAAAAKPLQSCLTLCDPIDSSPPGSPIPGILQARTLEWVAISFSNAWKWKVKGKSLSRVRVFATPWTAAFQAPPSIGFSRQEYWSVEPPRIKSVTNSIFPPSIFLEVMGPEAVILVFWMLSFKLVFSLSFSLFIKRLFGFSLLSALRVISSLYLRLLIFLLVILIPACDSSSPAFHMMYPAYKLNKQGDNIQLWRTPFPILNQSVVTCPVLTVASCPAYRFHRWSGIPISLRIFHSWLWSTQSKALA